MESVQQRLDENSERKAAGLSRKPKAQAETGRRGRPSSRTLRPLAPLALPESTQRPQLGVQGCPWADRSRK